MSRCHDITMKIILMGTPDFVVPIFDRIAAKHDIVAVFTRAPKPVGRKKFITKTPVHLWAESKNIPVFTSIKELIVNKEKLKVDYIMVVAYGVILKQEVLDFAPCLNVHYSLLPKYRGAHPVAAAIMNGDNKSGVCLQKMALELDAGDILCSSEFPILENETTDMVRIKASEIAGHLIEKFLQNPKAFPPKPQIGEPSYAKKEIGDNIDIDWTKPAMEIHNRIRAIGGRTKINGIDVKIIQTKVENEKLKLEIVQPNGKKPMPWKDFLNGQRGKCDICGIS